MSFFTPRSDMKIDGSEKNANIGTFTIIPDGTTAPALIKSVELEEFDDGTHIYKATLSLQDGDYKGQNVFMNMKCFDKNPKKRDRAVNQLLRLYKLCHKKPEHSLAPKNEELMILRDNIIGIEVGQWDMDGKQGNFIRGTYPYDADFETKTGEYIEPKTAAPEPRHEEQTTVADYARKKTLDEDLPF